GASALDIVQPVTIRGSGQTLTRPGSAAPFRLFYVDTFGDLELDNLTLNGGYVQGDNTVGGSAQGGAIFNIGRLYVSGCTFRQNEVFGGDYLNNGGGDGGYGMGGAIANSGTSFAVVNSTFFDNLAAGGQGLRPGSARGGAIFSNSDFMTVVHCTLYANTVSGDTRSRDSSNGGGRWGYRGRAGPVNSYPCRTPP